MGKKLKLFAMELLNKVWAELTGSSFSSDSVPDSESNMEGWTDKSSPVDIFLLIG